MILLFALFFNRCIDQSNLGRNILHLGTLNLSRGVLVLDRRCWIIFNLSRRGHKVWNITFDKLLELLREFLIFLYQVGVEMSFLFKVAGMLISHG
jgi:hypothetical protein